MDRVIALHLLRTGDFEVAETFIEVRDFVFLNIRVLLRGRSLPQEANVGLSPNHISQFYELRTVTEALRASDLDPALQCVCLLLHVNVKVIAPNALLL